MTFNDGNAETEARQITGDFSRFLRNVTVNRTYYRKKMLTGYLNIRMVAVPIPAVRPSAQYESINGGSTTKKMKHYKI